MSITLGQAIRNAIEGERAAASFYLDLAAATADGTARALLEQVAAEEREHAAGLELVARQLVDGALPERADTAVRGIESTPAADGARDLGFAQALSLALEAELSAALLYDGLASSCSGSVAEFFTRVAEQEERHAERIRAWLAGLEEAAGAPAALPGPGRSVSASRRGSRSRRTP